MIGYPLSHQAINGVDTVIRKGVPIVRVCQAAVDCQELLRGREETVHPDRGISFMLVIVGEVLMVGSTHC